MKSKIKKIAALICAAAAVTVSSTAFAAIEPKMNDGRIDVNLNGEYLTFDVNPLMINDRVMLPMRKIFESLGASVTWDDGAKTVTAEKDGTNIKLKIDSSEMTVNGETVLLDVPAAIVDGRTLVPVRAVSEALGASVAWFGHGIDIVTISTFPITCQDAIQIDRNIYKGYTWEDFTDEKIDALNLEIYGISYDSYSKAMVYRVCHNWGLRDEDGNELGGAHFINVKTGEYEGGAG